MKLLWLALIFYFPVCAQESMEVRYLIHFNDHLNDSIPSYRRHKGILRISGEYSFFFMDAIDKIDNSESANGISWRIDTALLVKTNFATKELYSLEFLLDRGFTWVKDSLHPMKWAVDTASKQIGGFKCLKATCFFRGRNYIVWFTPEIPIVAGPWKLGGLPGLIMEMEDDQRNFIAKFEKISPGATSFKMPLKSMTWVEFVKMRKRAIDDFVTSMNASQKADCLTCKTEVSVKMNDGLEKF